MLYLLSDDEKRIFHCHKACNAKVLRTSAVTEADNERNQRISYVKPIRCSSHQQ